MAMKFARPALIRINGNKVTDHNRGALGVDVERIETTNRMANGTMRKYFVADKRTFTLSWTDTPRLGVQTVDGFWSGQELRNFFHSPEGRGAFELRVYTNLDERTFTPYTVMASTFSHTVKKRWATWELWDFNVTLVEV